MQLELEHWVVDVKIEPIQDILKEETPTLELDPRIDDQNPWFAEYLKQAAHILYKPEDFKGDLLE